MTRRALKTLQGVEYEWRTHGWGVVLVAEDDDDKALLQKLLDKLPEKAYLSEDWAAASGARYLQGDDHELVLER